MPNYIDKKKGETGFFDFSLYIQKYKYIYGVSVYMFVDTYKKNILDMQKLNST